MQQLKDAFDWDVSIAADADYPTQTIVSSDLCRRLMQSGLKNTVRFYHRIDNRDAEQSVWLANG